MALSKSNRSRIQNAISNRSNEKGHKREKHGKLQISQQQKRTNQRLQRPIQATNSELRYPQPRARTAGILLKPQRRIHQLRNHSSQTQPERAAAAAEGRLKAGTGSAGTRRGHGHPGRPPALLPRGLNYSAARQLYSGAWAGAVPRHFLVGIGRANCLRAQRRVAGTVSSGWGWLTARRGERAEKRRTRRGEGGQRALERRTCGSSDWVARAKRRTWPT